MKKKLISNTIFLFLVLLLEHPVFCCDVHGVSTNYGIELSEREIPAGFYNYDVKYYEIDLSASDTSTYLSGFTSTIIEVISEELGELLFELSNKLEIDSVFVNGEKATYRHENGIINITDLAYPKGTNIFTRIYYNGNGQSSNWISGITTRKDNAWDKNITWTLSEPFGAKDWFPVKQVLEDKADSVKVSITVASHLKAGSNGILENVRTLPDGQLKYVWKSLYPTAYYLISFCVGEYQDYSYHVHLEGMEDSMLVQNYIYADSAYLSQNKVNIDRTGELLELFSELFGIYPFYKEKYGHCVAPMGGGMEHQTMTTISSFHFELVAHELAHQWFGNNVTCANWQDIWINEGFASYSEYLALEILYSRESADDWMQRAYGIIQTENDGSVYIHEENVSSEMRIFSQRLSYKKGAAIIHMLRYELQNDNVFFDILREFQIRFKDHVATGEDFKQLTEEISGQDFTTFFNQWYFGEGFPVYDIVWQHRNDTLTLYTVQTTSAESQPELFIMKPEIKLNFRDGSDTIFTILQDEKNEVHRFYITREVTSVAFDPANWYLKKINNNQEIKDERLKNYYFEVNPVPFSSKIKISFSQTAEHDIMIIDTLGRKLEHQITNDDVIRINTSDFPSGVYFILVNTGDKQYSRKMIKQ